MNWIILFVHSIESLLTYCSLIHSAFRIYRDRNMYAVCPRCDNAMEYEYQLYCNHCGQHLEWSKYDEAEEEYIGWNSTEDDEDDEEDGDSDY